jgi:hypothetical protein
LREQESELKRALVESCRRFGLVVVGYSGRDHSVMEALEEATRTTASFPAGLFWIVRSDAIVFERVVKLLEVARASGTDAQLIEVETFDEFLGDIFAQLPDVSDDVAQKVVRRMKPFSYAPMPNDAGTYPAIRLNALPITELPTVCRLLECTIGNTNAVSEAIRASGENLVATRRRIGVIGFGSDAAMHRTFGPYNITNFDVHQIEFKRLAYDSAELNIVSAALACALTRGTGLRAFRKRSGYRLAAENEVDASFAPIKKLLNVAGTVPGTSVRVRPALDVRLDVRFGRAWLLMEPAILFDEASSASDEDKARDYVRERLAVLYNRQYSQLLDAWIKRLFGSESELRISALGIADGLDAAFVISRTPAFTWRQR